MCSSQKRHEKSRWIMFHDTTYKKRGGDVACLSDQVLLATGPDWINTSTNPRPSGLLAHHSEHEGYEDGAVAEHGQDDAEERRDIQQCTHQSKYDEISRSGGINRRWAGRRCGSRRRRNPPRICTQKPGALFFFSLPKACCTRSAPPSPLRWHRHPRWHHSRRHSSGPLPWMVVLSQA